MTTREKMHNMELYLPTEKEIWDEQQGYMDRLYDFNHTRPTEADKREALLKELFAEIGDGCYIEPPLHANWGGQCRHKRYSLQCFGRWESMQSFARDQ